jgi:hypothetical protein
VAAFNYLRRLGGWRKRRQAQRRNDLPPAPEVRLVNSIQPSDRNRLDAVHWLDCLLLCLAVCSFALAMVSMAQAPDACSSRTTTKSTSADARSSLKARESVEIRDCKPASLSGGFPQLAALIGTLLILPVLSRRIADGFEAGGLGVRVAKTRRVEGERVVSTVRDELSNDPANDNN